MRRTKGVTLFLRSTRIGPWSHKRRASVATCRKKGIDCACRIRNNRSLQRQDIRRIERIGQRHQDSRARRTTFPHFHAVLRANCRTLLRIGVADIGKHATLRSLRIRLQHAIIGISYTWILTQVLRRTFAAIACNRLQVREAFRSCGIGALKIGTDILKIICFLETRDKDPRRLCLIGRAVLSDRSGRRKLLCTRLLIRKVWVLVEVGKRSIGIHASGNINVQIIQRTCSWISRQQGFRSSAQTRRCRNLCTGENDLRKVAGPK